MLVEWGNGDERKKKERKKRENFGKGKVWNMRHMAMIAWPTMIERHKKHRNTKRWHPSKNACKRNVLILPIHLNTDRLGTDIWKTQNTYNLKHIYRHSHIHSHRKIDDLNCTISALTILNWPLYNTDKDIKTYCVFHTYITHQMDTVYVESVTYKTTTTFIHEQSRHKSVDKKGLCAFFTPHRTDH